MTINDIVFRPSLRRLASEIYRARETGPNQWLALLDHDGVPCLFDMALAQYEWWDA